MSKAWAGGSTRRWREHVRPSVLARDNNQCQIRLPGMWLNHRGDEVSCRVVADCVHHTLGKAVTGDDPDYCVAACTPCNLRVGDPTEVPDPLPRRATQW